MKNIILVTIQDFGNLGNRLQNYALQSVLEQMGYGVDNLNVVPFSLSIPQRIKNQAKHFLGLVGKKQYYFSYVKSLRKNRGLEFTKRYIHGLTVLERDKLSSCDWKKYDVAVSGSDQVWHNWKRIKSELSFFYLDFVIPEKRISYAPSFGFTKFPNEDLEEHREGLMKMKALSCREQEGCRLIKELTGRDAQKVLDPTLLLTREEWEKIEKKPDFSVPENYLMLFFLGDIAEEYQQEITRIKGVNVLELLNINDLNDPKHYAISPDEFIWLIHHADTVCTDSFHASVFSILFNRNMRVFPRKGKYENMFGRLYDLLEPYGLLELAYGYGDGSKLSTELNANAKQCFFNDRNKSLHYLRESLQINEN